MEWRSARDIPSNLVISMLKGKNVFLRAVRSDDLPRLCEFNNDLAVELSVGGSPPMPQTLERMQSEFNGSVAKGGRDGTWFAIETEGVLIGQCGLHGLTEQKGIAHSCDIGITIGDRSYWGRGLGREAVKLLLEYAFQYWNMQRVGLKTHSGNERAIRCYKACGFTEEGRLRRREWNDGHYVDSVFMSILREEWEEIYGRHRN
jgi:RimJ/RimL family protein N-acetyltransferase